MTYPKGGDRRFDASIFGGGDSVGDFTKLAVWKKAHELTLGIYRRSSEWPRYELFGLTSQARRAASSVPANLAEGCGRNSDAELARSARTALGSASELSYWLILAHDLDYIERAERDGFQESVSEIRRMLTSLESVASLAAENASPRRSRR
jgi:four helix bundle protein